MTRTPRFSPASTLFRVDTDTDRAAWNTAWKSAWPVLRRHCAHLMYSDADMADDLAAEVAASLCARYARGGFHCDNLVGYACGLAHLRQRRVWEANARHGRQLERFRIHRAMRNGRKVVTSHELMYDEEKNDETRE